MPRGMSFSPLIKPLIEVWSSSFVALGVATDDSLRISIQPEDEASVQGKVTNAVNYPIVATIQKMRTDKKLVSEYLGLQMQMLMGSCFEIFKEHGMFLGIEDVPEVTFFRHIRNGCFHGNKFHFKRGQPKGKPSWRGLTIQRSLQGTPVFPRFLVPADALHLLEDISALVDSKTKGRV